jgi:DNA-binding MarR family transcriptional regulator
MKLRERLRQDRFTDSGEEAIIAVLVLAGHVRAELGLVCEKLGLTHDQYNVLRILRGVHPGGHPRYAIAERLVDRSPDVTRLLDRLERQGLVERARSNEDRRLSVSRITARGLALLDEMEPEIRAVHERFAGRISESQQRELARTCGFMLP